MPVYSETEVRDSINELLGEHNLTWEEFVALGETDELVEIDSDLDFAYRALVPSLRGTTTPA